jgi:hypothetical protein
MTENVPVLGKFECKPESNFRIVCRIILFSGPELHVFRKLAYRNLDASDINATQTSREQKCVRLVNETWR